MKRDDVSLAHCLLEAKKPEFRIGRAVFKIAGLDGWGEPVLEGHLDAVLACVKEMADYLYGRNPLHIEDIWTMLYRAGFYRGGGVLMSAIAGIDQALWDIKSTSPYEASEAHVP